MSNARELPQKLTQRMSALKIVNKVLERDSSAAEARVPLMMSGSMVIIRSGIDRNRFNSAGNHTGYWLLLSYWLVATSFGRDKFN
jgi:hypothetical protein